MQALSADKVCFIILKAREFDVKVAPVDEEDGSNPGDEREVDVLEDQGDDPTLEELVGALRDLNEDERIELLALIWLGRGDVETFGEAKTLARDRYNKRFVRYVIGIPLLGDYLEEGLAELGYDCADLEREHL